MKEETLHVIPQKYEGSGASPPYVYAQTSAPRGCGAEVLCVASCCSDRSGAAGPCPEGRLN